MGELLSLGEVAKVLGVTYTRAYQIVIEEKKIPSQKTGNQWCVKAVHLRIFMESQIRKDVEKEIAEEKPKGAVPPLHPPL